MTQYAFITGGLGFIGSFIARNLLADRLVDKCVLIDSYAGYISPFDNILIDHRRFRLKGIEDQIIVERTQTQHLAAIYQLLTKYRPKYIFHLAALPLASIDNLTTEEAMEGSLQSTANLLEICGHLVPTDYKPERFVYASSSMVYGDFLYSPVDELHPICPRNIYGTMKAAGEVATLGLARTFNIPASIVRPSAVYGPTDMNRRVSQIFIENAMAGKKLIIHGEDEELDFTYVEDTAEGFVLAATKDEAVGEIFNITAGRAHRLVDFALLLKEHFPDVTMEIRERDHDRPKRGTLTTEKACKLLGYQPRYTLKMGIDKCVEFVRSVGED